MNKDSVVATKSLPISLPSLTALYLALPLVIFFIGWLKPYWAAAAIFPILYSGWRLLRCWPDEPQTVSRNDLYIIGVFSFALTGFLGIGAAAPQPTDWIKHNAVLYDCITRPWPVMLEDGPKNWPLVYYLAYYLPATLVGKAAGYAAAQATLWIWTSLGVMLASFWFARLAKLPALAATLAFFAFAGLDFLANLLAQILRLSFAPGPLNLFPDQWWSRIWQFPASVWALQWAPGQALAGWLAGAMFLGCDKRLRPAVFAFLFVCALLWSPFADAGFGLLALFLVKPEDWARPVKPMAAMLPLALPFGALIAFYSSKISPDVAHIYPPVPIVWFTHFYFGPHNAAKSMLLFGMFVFFTFGVWLFFIRRSFAPGTEERTLANACGLALLCVMPMTAGNFNDLALRASAAPWFCLTLLTVRTAINPGLAPATRKLFWMVALIAFLTPFLEVAHQAYHLVIRKYDYRTIPRTGDHKSALANMQDNNFPMFGAQYVGSTNSFFFRVLAK